MSAKKPISKIQGRFWIIRRPNESIMPGILARTRRVAISQFSRGNPEFWKHCRAKGYTVEKVQVMSLSKSGDVVTINSFSRNANGTLVARDSRSLRVSPIQLATDPDDPRRIRNG